MTYSFHISKNGLVLFQISGEGTGALTQLDAECLALNLSRRADHHLSSIVFCSWQF
jgi:hypothetical protein